MPLVKMSATVAVAALTVLAAGCAGREDTASAGGRPAAVETIAYEVGPCFGFCPVYNAAISSDGDVSFEGVRHTATLGVSSSKVDQRAYIALAEDLAAYRPARGASATTTCDARISDQQHYRIVWTAADGTRSVLEHDRGCRSARNDGLNVILQSAPVRLGIAGLAKQLTRPGASRG
jgi:hypothetical protein